MIYHLLQLTREVTEYIYKKQGDLMAYAKLKTPSDYIQRRNTLRIGDEVHTFSRKKK